MYACACACVSKCESLSPSVSVRPWTMQSSSSLERKDEEGVGISPPIIYGPDYDNVSRDVDASLKPQKCSMYSR
jgi:hypothetical protein